MEKFVEITGKYLAPNANGPDDVSYLATPDGILSIARAAKMSADEGVKFFFGAGEYPYFHVLPLLGTAQ